MNKEPEALNLAEKLERYDADRSGYAKHCHVAAAELRRLHAVNVDLLEALRVAKAGEKLCEKALKARAVEAKLKETRNEL